MKVELWQIGKTAFPYLEEGIKIYQKRLSHYTKFDIQTIPDIKNAGKLSAEQLKEKEGEQILKKLEPTDHLILLDESGKTFSSEKFADYIQQLQLNRHKRVIFLIGGAFGFSPAVYSKAKGKLSLSKMTFSHQMVRLFFVEQLYRGFTILNNERYHNR